MSTHEKRRLRRKHLRSLRIAKIRSMTYSATLGILLVLPALSNILLNATIGVVFGIFSVELCLLVVHCSAVLW